METWKLLAVSHLAAGLTGYVLAPRERLDSEVEYTGLFSADAKRTLAAAVLSLRQEDRLLVWTYKGAASVSVERSELLGLLSGSQHLTVPATVSYFVDLSGLGNDDVHWDEAAKLVTVRLQPLVLGEVAVHGAAAQVINEGVLTYSDRHVQDLLRLNHATARTSFIKLAQETTLVAIAERQAAENVERLFKVLLGASGQPDVRVVAKFRER